MVLDTQLDWLRLMEVVTVPDGRDVTDGNADVLLDSEAEARALALTVACPEGVPASGVGVPIAVAEDERKGETESNGVLETLGLGDTAAVSEGNGLEVKVVLGDAEAALDGETVLPDEAERDP